MTSETLTEEIFREEGENFRSVMVTLEPGGGLMMDTQDMGKLVSPLIQLSIREPFLCCLI